MVIKVVPSIPGAEWPRGIPLSKQTLINPPILRTVSTPSDVPDVPKFRVFSSTSSEEKLLVYSTNYLL